jgi:drug/metabolite transporter superfamily protein YnfA
MELLGAFLVIVGFSALSVSGYNVLGHIFLGLSILHSAWLYRDKPHRILRFWSLVLVLGGLAVAYIKSFAFGAYIAAHGAAPLISSWLMRRVSSEDRPD